MPTADKKGSDDVARRFCFSDTKFSLEAACGGSKKRKFSGTAYSGGMIANHWYWGNLVFDLDSMSVPAKLPALVDHDRGARCGYVTESSINHTDGLSVHGNLLSNEHGCSVAQDSDDGFPWQMSVHIEPGSIEEVQAGKSVNVNGRDFNGPITVFRNSTIAEVSFTATGWDSNTSAAAMSRGNNTSQGEDAMDLKELQDRVAALEADKATLQASNADLTTKLGEANAKLDQFSKDTRTKEVKQLFADIGREYKEDSDEAKSFSAMPDAAFATTATMLRDQFKKGEHAAGSTLFSHQATGGAAPGTTTAQGEDPLLANAKKRAEQFSKRAG